MLIKSCVILIFISSLLHSHNCDVFTIDSDQNIRAYSEKLGFCSYCYQYASIDNYIIGKITLPNLKLGDVINVTFNSDFSEDDYKHFPGTLLLDESTEEIMNRLREGKRIPFRIDFPPSLSMPELLSILINGKEFCSTLFTDSGKGQKLNLEHKLKIVNDALATFKYSIPIPHFAKASTCGLDDTEVINNRLTPFIHGGTTVRRGEYPWLTAIYRKRANLTIFICGGSLLSSSVILSAAHCFPALDLKTEKIVAHLGSHNLTNPEENGAVVRQIDSVILHPEYKPVLNFSDADLAILKIQTPVYFTQYIRPICLWVESADLSIIIDRTVVIAGWGSDENGVVANLPKKVKTTVVSETECLRSSSIYAAITSQRTFCAGRRDGTGPCVGDSGGGLMINRNGRWMLRGVISAGLTAGKSCDLQEYTVYCDVAKHMSWLDNYVSEQEVPIKGAVDTVCGKSGKEVRNENPWLAAIYIKTYVGELFVCTGVLISSRTVLTTANWIDVQSGQLFGPNDVRVYLGRYNLTDMTESRVVARDVAALIRHPNYRVTASLLFDDDLSLIHLKAPVSFTHYVKPICLWSEHGENLELTGQMANLSSWDTLSLFNESLAVPMSMEVKIVPNEQCQMDGYPLATSSSFLCTPRFGNNMDGILILKRNDSWAIRGLATGNLLYYAKYKSRNYRVYTDIKDYLWWIQSNMLS